MHKMSCKYHMELSHDTANLCLAQHCILGLVLIGLWFWRIDYKSRKLQIFFKKTLLWWNPGFDIFLITNIYEWYIQQCKDENQFNHFDVLKIDQTIHVICFIDIGLTSLCCYDKFYGWSISDKTKFNWYT
jgi:hypothetical protein